MALKWKIALSLYCAAVLYISSLPPGNLPEQTAMVPDKVLHMIEYAIMGILAWGAFGISGGGFPWGLLLQCGVDSPEDAHVAISGVTCTDCATENLLVLNTLHRVSQVLSDTALATWLRQWARWEGWEGKDDVLHVLRDELTAVQEVAALEEEAVAEARCVRSPGTYARVCS